MEILIYFLSCLLGNLVGFFIVIFIIERKKVKKDNPDKDYKSVGLSFK